MDSRNQFGEEQDIYTVSEFNRTIKNLLEENLGKIWIKGEISNLRRQASGHIYFSLKDSKSQVSCVFFRGNAMRCPVDPDNGLQIIAFGETSVFEPRGNYQLIIRTIVDDGAGRLQQKFDALKRKLAEEGLFEASAKKRLPLLPENIGFVSSPSGAAIRDFISVLDRRGWKGKLIVIPARVQGREASEEIVEGIREAEKLGNLDLLVIGRGGGSLEDLWPFNEEAVVRAVAGSPLPVISAVGHQIDFTLSDFAADHRAETPSAAAELISSQYLNQILQLNQNAEQMNRTIDHAVSEKRQDVNAGKNHMRLLAPTQLIENQYQHVDDLAQRFNSVLISNMGGKKSALDQGRAFLTTVSPNHKIDSLKKDLVHIENFFQNQINSNLKELNQTVKNLAFRLQNNSLYGILRKGFVLLKDTAGQYIISVKQVNPGQKVEAQFHDGILQFQNKKHK